MPGRGETKLTGRPPKITEELIERIANLIRGGNYIETAARAAGLPKQTLYEWLKKGQKPENPLYYKFRDAVEMAVAQSEARDLSMVDAYCHGSAEKRDAKGQLVREAVKPNPNVLTWRLERRFPKRWGRQDRLDLTTTELTPQDAAEGMTPEQRQERIDRLIRELRGDD